MKNFLVILSLLYYLTSLGQAGSEIILFDCKVVNSQVYLSRGINITNHKGYDNQPSFHPTKPILYYSSFNDSGRSDIKYFDFEKNETKNLTLTREREYSPTVTPDGQFISCIIQRDNKAQDLCKYPVEGGKPEVLVNNLTIGYHAWAGDNKLLLYVLDDTVNNSLHYYHLIRNTDTVIAKNIGRSLHKIPGKNSMSFVQRISDKESIIKRFDINTGVISTIVPTLPGQDHMTWLQNGLMLMSDGNTIFARPDRPEVNWQPVIIDGDSPMLRGISRLAANTANTKLAIVISE